MDDWTMDYQWNDKNCQNNSSRLMCVFERSDLHEWMGNGCDVVLWM